MADDNISSPRSSSSNSSNTLNSSSSSISTAWSKVAEQTPQETEDDRIFNLHLSLLRPGSVQQGLEDIKTTPLFSMPVLKGAESEAIGAGGSSPAFPQYGLLAGMTRTDQSEFRPEWRDTPSSFGPRIFFNVAAPSSTFICGSQGSGKSHTLSCLLEDCLIPSDANKLPRPLTGLVFHYDTFICDEGGSPCEAAYLSSDPNIKVRVLCSPTNIRTIKGTYHAFKNVTVEPLRISEDNLNTKRMLDLMAVSRGNEPMPLYLHAVYRILREMRIEQQEMGAGFSYTEFKNRIAATEMTPAQLGPLTQRLDTLESFMPDTQTGTTIPRQKGKKTARQYGNDWTPKFMNESAEAQTLTDTLLSTIRLQRHLAARVIISTQEPTISPDLLDLCTVTVVHRFTSPEWMRSLKAHLAAAAPDMIEPELDSGDEDSDVAGALIPGAEVGTPSMIFKKIVELEVGEALLFSPSAMLGVDVASGGGRYARLGAGFVKVRVRSRLTDDGGKTNLAA
ncbi:hypothetical protein V494_03067 [Pseudogymnoascus sp. VKM F-4513 (FW-928)]|nr:hypothetical protein V494_03067 [Pseudogymnoascus sp. VKM F-4513 (FW-928)]